MYNVKFYKMKKCQIPPTHNSARPYMIKCEMQILPKTVLAAAGIIFIGEVSMGWVGGYL